MNEIRKIFTVFVLSLIFVYSNINAETNANIVHNYEGTNIEENKNIETEQLTELNSFYKVSNDGTDYEIQKVTIQSERKYVTITVNYHIDTDYDGVSDYIYPHEIKYKIGSNVFIDDLRSMHPFAQDADFIYSSSGDFKATEDEEVSLFFEGDLSRRIKLLDAMSLQRFSTVHEITDNFDTATYSFSYLNDYKIIIDYKKVEKYNVLYHANGALGSLTDTNEYKIGDTAIVKDSSTLSLDGYEFINWNTNADGSGETYNSGANITIEGNVELYAQWKKLDNDNSDNDSSNNDNSDNDNSADKTKNTGSDKLPQTGSDLLFISILFLLVNCSLILLYKRKATIL